MPLVSDQAKQFVGWEIAGPVCLVLLVVLVGWLGTVALRATHERDQERSSEA